MSQPFRTPIDDRQTTDSREHERSSTLPDHPLTDAAAVY